MAYRNNPPTRLGSVALAVLACAPKLEVSPDHDNDDPGLYDANNTSSSGGASSTSHNHLAGRQSSSTGGALSGLPGGTSSTGAASSTGPVTSTGAASSTGPVTSTGANTDTPYPCSRSVDFVAIAAKTTTYDWVDSTSNPCGISGTFYAFGDKVGSLTSPSPITGAGDEYASPCTADRGCCISGVTTLWTELVNLAPTYAEWGAGLGFSLADDPRDSYPKTAYTGPVKGFTFTVKGQTSGQRVSVSVNHTAEASEMPPLVRETALGTWDVRFTDAKCSDYPYIEPKCEESTSGVYDVKVVVAGGDAAGAFDLCLTSLIPIL